MADCAGVYPCVAATSRKTSTGHVRPPSPANCSCNRTLQCCLLFSRLGLIADSELKFYTLPEFTPASKLKIRDANNCCEDLYREGEVEEDGSVLVTVLTRAMILRIKVEKEAKRVKVPISNLYNVT